ncbi:MAG: penicillin-binding protein 2 [Actinomycetes bacterium]
MRRLDTRIRTIFVALAALFVFAGARAGYLGTVRADALGTEASSQQAITSKVPAPRGDITDRNGTELAVSEAAVDVVANPMIIKSPADLAAKLAPLLGSQPEELLPKLSDRSRGFVYIARRMPAEVGDRIKAMHQTGLSLEQTMRRSYPRGQQAGQLLGFVGNEGKGLSGLEYAWNSELQGTDGQRTTVSDALGRPINVADNAMVQKGRDIRLTIDAPLQDEVERVLEGVGRVYQPKGATAVAVDPRTGDILALANWPAVNANDVGSASAYAQLNRASGFTYEPGSTFKSFTISGALQDRVVTPDTQFDLPVELQVGDKTIHDAEDRGPETLPVKEILSKSSNVGAAKIGMRTGAKRFDHWVREFGFGSPTGSGLPGEEAGIVLTPEHYSDATLGNMAMGQGLAVTPLQMIQAYGAIANGGILKPPRLVSEVGGKQLDNSGGHRVISPQTAASVREMLKGVLGEGGTASSAAIPGFDLAGKTGTAQKVDPQTGTYSDSKYIASFIGFAPASKPKLLVAVVVDEPTGEIYGGQVAAPAFSRIMAWALPYLGINPQ